MTQSSDPSAPLPPPPEAIERAETCLRNGQLDDAWRLALPWRPAVRESRALADLWVGLLRVTRGYPYLLDDAKQLLAQWGSDPTLVLAVCDALVRTAEQRPIDEPPLTAEHPGGIAAHAARTALAALPADLRQDTALRGYLEINLANGLRLSGPDQFEAADRAFATALETCPDKGWWWFNWGLLHKARGAWSEGLRANREARSRLGDERPVLWNLAICATALGDAEQAVEAWNAAGVKARLSDTGMPYVPDLEPMQVRVATMGTGHGAPGSLPDNAVGFELVWVLPFSPCHGVIQSPTFRQASVDYGDVVLWDGSPVAVHELDGRQIPIVPLLTQLSRGKERRYRFVALQDDPEGLEAFGADLPGGAQLFVHRPGQDLSHLRAFPDSANPAAPAVATPATQGRPLVYGKIIVGGDVDLSAFRRQFEAHLKSQKRVNLVMPGLLEDIGDSQAAGKAHQAWRGVEKAAEKAAERNRALH